MNSSKNTTNNNGYDYVDLELPSGTLWATMNVGASKPSDFGLYFQWGDTQGYTADQVGTKKKFALDWGDYKWNPNGDGKTFTKYTHTGDTLDLKDDAAHVNMGGDWHIPTPEQIQELIVNTTSSWKTTQNYVNGITFTSKKDKSKSIFIPAAGYAFNGSVRSHRYIGQIWSSTLDRGFAKYSQSLHFNEGDAYLTDYHTRCHGFSVRGVIDKSTDDSKEKINDMKEEINLVEILKDCPQGTKLWSPLYGECELVAIEEGLYPIHCTYKRSYVGTSFTANSEFNIYFKNEEGVLTPSKNSNDWSTFKVTKTHKHFESYQKVLIKDKFCSKYFWVAALYSHYNALTNKHYLIGANWAEDEDIIPYEGNEDKLGKPVEE